MTASSGLEQWDLTSKNSSYLDRHMMFPLLEYLDSLIESDKISYSSKDVASARLSLLRPTHMVDYAVDMYKSVHGDSAEIPKEMEERKTQVFKELEELESGCKPLTELCANEEEKAKLVSSGKWSLAALSQDVDKNITSDVLETYRKTAKFQFECGDYKGARDMLENYISLLAKPPTTDNANDEDEGDGYKSNNKQQNEKKEDVGNPAIYYLKSVDAKLLQVLWGRLACEILVEQWEAASVALDAVKAALEALVSSKRMSAIEALSTNVASSLVSLCLLEQFCAGWFGTTCGTLSHRKVQASYYHQCASFTTLPYGCCIVVQTPNHEKGCRGI